MSDFESARQSYRKRSELALASRLPGPADSPQRLHQAMRHACLNGGKRFRAMLVYACGEVAGAKPSQLDAPAAAVEMIHAYSLIHDDLPAMDDDDLRRGQPACHIAYDQATAILAGDALQTLAFEILSDDPTLTIPAMRRLQMIKVLTHAAGHDGMAGGQALDMAAVGGSSDGSSDGLGDELANKSSNECTDIVQLKRIHELKTGALIRAAAQLGGLAAPHAEEALLNRLDQYAASVGLAFQIVDDILDVSAGEIGEAGETNEAFGKRGGADQRMNKATYTSVLGKFGARAEAQKLCRNALETAGSLGDNSGFFQQLAHFVVNRSF